MNCNMCCQTSCSGFADHSSEVADLLICLVHIAWYEAILPFYFAVSALECVLLYHTVVADVDVTCGGS